MLKLYKITESEKRYWETWERDGTHTVHWGVLGTTGESKDLQDTPELNARDVIQSEIDQMVSDGFETIEDDDHAILLIEYPVEGFGTSENLKKRYELQDQMGETLGWTGLGHCDGGSIGSGTMEVCCFVVDFEIAKQVIEEDLKDTEFSDYSRIHLENG